MHSARTGAGTIRAAVVSIAAFVATFGPALGRPAAGQPAAGQPAIPHPCARPAAATSLHRLTPVASTRRESGRTATAGLATLAGNAIVRADGRRVPLPLPRGATATAAAQVPSGWLVEARQGS